MQNMFAPYTPYNFQPFSTIPAQAQTQPTMQLVKVTGLDGAKAYQMPANSAAVLFHESEDIFYVKSTDGAGFPTIRSFRFEPYEEPVNKEERYVTLEEFNKFKEEFYAKQPVRKPSAKSGAGNTAAEE